MRLKKNQSRKLVVKLISGSDFLLLNENKANAKRQGDVI